MLYAAFEVYRSALEFWGGGGLGMPWAALAAPPRERTRSVEPAGFDLDATTIGGRRIAVREAVVSARPFPTLSHFEGAVKRRDPRVLVIAPLSGHHPTVLYQMVATLLPDHDVYLAGWRNARDVPLDEDPFDLDTYIEYVQQFIVELGPELHVIAVSQATVPALATRRRSGPARCTSAAP